MNNTIARFALIRLLFTSSREQRQAILKVLRDQEMFEVFVSGVEDRINLIGSDRPIMDFLEWLLANKDEILEFIMMIIQLFTPTD